MTAPDTHPPADDREPSGAAMRVLYRSGAVQGAIVDGDGWRVATFYVFNDTEPRDIERAYQMAAAPLLFRALDRFLGDVCECDAPGAIGPCVHCEGWDAIRAAQAPDAEGEAQS